MIHLDLIFNLTLPVVISIVSGFIEQRWPRHTRLGVLLQGALFGGAAVLGMSRPLSAGPGHILDGRSIMVSLCALFFGPWAAAAAGVLTIACRIWLGGTAILIGEIAILSSAGIGLLAHYRLKPEVRRLSVGNLYLFGLAVTLAMLALMFALSGGAELTRIGLPVMLLYPLATVLAGKILSDQAESERAKDALRENNARLDLALRSACMGVWHWDIIENKRYFDDYSCQLLGINPATFTGAAEELFGAVHPDDRETIKAALARTIEQDVLYEPDYRAVWPDGSVHYITARGKLVRDDKGRALRISGIIWDVTERKRVEEALHKSEKDLKEAQRLAKIGSWDWNATTDTIAWSEEYCRIFGFDPAQRPPGYEEHKKAYTPESAARLDAAVKRNMQTGGAYDVDLELAGTEGSHRWVTARSETKRDAQGKIVGLRGTAQDITERKRAEAALRQAKEQAETANRYKTEFLMNISHDLRTPLNAILGFAYILKSVDMAEKYRKGVDLINERAKYLHVLVEDILDVSRMESGRIELKSREFDFYKLLDNSIEAARVTVGKKELTLSLAVKGTIPRLKGDALRVQQIVENLLSNAVKYTERGAIHVTVELDDAQPDKDTCRARVSVKDTGIGIPAEKLPYIFDPFTRFHEFYKGKTFDGVGLGLHIVQELVRLMGGSVSVSSEVNKGSEFIFTLNFDKVSGAA